jgi:hypothetical protein
MSNKLIPVVFMMTPIGSAPQPMHPRYTLERIIGQALMVHGCPDNFTAERVARDAILLFAGQLCAWNLHNLHFDHKHGRQDALPMLAECVDQVARIPGERPAAQPETPATLTEAKAA